MKRNIILIFTVLLGLSWFMAISEFVNNPKKVAECLEKAAELEEKGIYVDAITEYEKALEYEPDRTEIYVKMANAYLMSGNSSKFVSYCEQTAELYQDDTEAMDTLMNYYIENDYEYKAVKYLNEFIENHPQNENAQSWFLELKGSYSEMYCYYDEMSNIVNDYMVVKEEALYGIADALGNEIIANEYKYIQAFSKDGFALAQKTDGSYIYIDVDGQVRRVPEESYKNLGMFNAERAVSSKNGKYGYLDEDMEPVGEFIWDELTGIQNNTGAAKKDGKWVLINKDAEEKGDEQYDDVICDEAGFCSYQKRIFVKQGKNYFIINNKGKIIGNLTFDDAKAFTKDGYAAVCNDGKWGFVDKDGELVIDYKYEDALSFQNGYAAVCVDGAWGYIDEEGNLIIEPKFTVATNISSQGTAAVKTSMAGEEVWSLIRLNVFL